MTASMHKGSNWLTFVEFDPVTPTDWCWPTTLCTLHNDTDIDAMRIKEVADDDGGGDDADAGQVWQREPAVQRQLLFYFVFSLTPWKQLITKLRQRQRRLQSIKDVLAKTSWRIMDERSKKEKKRHGEGRGRWTRRRSHYECQAKNSAKPLTMLLFVGIVGGCRCWWLLSMRRRRWLLKG